MKYRATLSRISAIATLVSAILLTPGLAHGQLKQATSNASLDGPYFAHDLFELFSDEQVLGEGTRTFNDNGILNRLFTFPASTPLNYEVGSDGTFRLFSEDLDWGFGGSIGLGGQLAVFTVENPPNADPDVREGYASLQVSLSQRSGMNDATFSGTYSYHALIRRSDDVYQTSFGVATSNGQGRYFVIRESTTAYTYAYDVSSDGRIDLGAQNPNDAAISADGELIVNTADLGRNDDAEIPGGYTGMALYLRRFKNNDAALSDFRGSYRVHQLSANGTADPTSHVGTVVAGGNGYFFGDLGGEDYAGQIALNGSGTFRFIGSSAFQGSLGADGNVAIVTSTAGTTSSMAIWVRTAGGPGNSLDRDGDGLTDAEEGILGSNPTLADTDGDGLLDNADARPTIADNVIEASLSESEIVRSLTDEEISTISLTLDTQDFPFFAWTLHSSAPWLSPAVGEGFGDGVIALQLDTTDFEIEDSPYSATIEVRAPAMAPLAPLSLQVILVSNQVSLEVVPQALAFTVVEGEAAHTQTVSLSSPDNEDFSWSVSETLPWVNIAPESGNGPDTVEITVDPASLTSAESPYATSVVFLPGGTGPNKATVDIVVDVLPPRAVGTPFPVFPSEDAQHHPALAFDTETQRWVMAWVEDGNILGLVLDKDLIPLGSPTRLSIGALGLASNPVVLVVETTQEAWVLWEQRADPMSDGFIQARAFDLVDLSLGNTFGFSGLAGDKSELSAAYNPENDAVVLTFNQAQGEDQFIGFIRIHGASRATLSREFPITSPHPQTLPAVAWLADTNSYLVLWRETVTNAEEVAHEEIRAVRLHGESGDAIDDVLILDDDVPNGANLRLAAANGFRRWVAAWTTSTSLGTPGVLHTVSVSGAGDLGSIYTAEEVHHPSTPLSMVYNDESKLLTMLWSRTPAGGGHALVYRHAASTGQPLGERIALPGNPANGSSTAVGANSLNNEFLLVWEDPAAVPRQLRALRIDGGSGDVDDDGMPNEWELSFGLDPFSADGDDGPDGDPDLDDLRNLAEFLLGTNPTEPDSDSDGLLDGQEDENQNGIVDEGETNPLDTDSDDDGVQDDVEWFLGSDGRDPASSPGTGIYRIDYGTWTPGVASPLTVFLYVSAAESYAVAVNGNGDTPLQTAEGWLLSAEDTGAFRTLESGTHELVYFITPTATITTDDAYGSFRFSLYGKDGLIDQRSALLVADLLPPPVDTGGVSAQALAEAYAPVLRLHRDALFTPIPVEVSFGNAVQDLGNTMVLPVAATAIGLHQSPYIESFLDLPGEDTDGLFAAYPAPDALPAPRAYYTVTNFEAEAIAGGAPTRHLSIQYYLHFFADVWGLDQQGGHRHEGDWEVFQVLVDEAGVAYQAAASQQWQLAQQDGSAPGGESRAWTALELDNEHPVLYVAKGSHSLYFQPGATRYSTGIDVHDGIGFWMISERGDDVRSASDYDKTISMSLSPLRRLNESNPTRWLRFPGTWGQPAYPIPETDSPDPPVNDGPVGPVFLHLPPIDAESDGVLRVWSSPYAFATGMPVVPPALSSQLRGRVPPAYRGARILLMDARGRTYYEDIDGISGIFTIDVPVQNYSLAVVSLDEREKAVLQAMMGFEVNGTRTTMLTATEGPLELGTFTLTDGILIAGANLDTLDSDGDGIIDILDSDRDNDGIANEDDSDVTGDGWDDRYQTQDSDKDGIPRFLDDDDDNDGTPDLEDSDRDGNGVEDVDEPADLDQDGFVDALDLDLDNDGFDNATEVAAGTDPRHYLDTPLRRVGDLDGDGDVDAADGQQLVNQGLGRAPYAPRADFDLNGRIDAGDLQQLVNIVVEKA